MTIREWTLPLVLAPVVLLAAATLTATPARAQQEDGPVAGEDLPQGGPSAEAETPEARAARLLAEGERQRDAEAAAAGDAAAAQDAQVEEQINLLTLLIRG